MKTNVKLLAQICEVAGAPGYEQRVRELVLKNLKGVADKIEQDNIQHEQLHFDITELYARLFRKRLSDEVKSLRDIKKINAIGKQILSDWDKEQKNYDRETNHSMNTKAQMEWIANVHERMEVLSEFASK